ncbi:hypothetical protein GGI04_005727, partial [Coemansia thaxteri]
FPGAFESPEETPPYRQPNNVPLDPSPPPLDNLTAAERIESQISQVREQAEEWLAFYAQKFYVAQTQSFLRCSHLFMPTVEKNMHIIDYEAVSASAAAAFTTADDSQRYQLATQGLPPDLCRLFVDASDISQDFELFDSLIPDTMKNGIPSE